MLVIQEKRKSSMSVHSLHQPAARKEEWCKKKPIASGWHPFAIIVVIVYSSKERVIIVIGTFHHESTTINVTLVALFQGQVGFWDSHWGTSVWV